MAFKLFFLPAEPHLLFANKSLLQIPRLKQTKVHGAASLPRRPLSHSANSRNSWRPLTTYCSLMNIHGKCACEVKWAQENPMRLPKVCNDLFSAAPTPPPTSWGMGNFTALRIASLGTAFPLSLLHWGPFSTEFASAPLCLTIKAVTAELRPSASRKAISLGRGVVCCN